MVVEFTGMTFVAVLRGDGVTGKKPGKQSLPHFRTSPVFHDRMGLCCTNYGCPRIMSAVEPSRTRR